jgi:hypothetical protein
VISALASTNVPGKTHALCEDATVIGSCSRHHVEGRILWDPTPFSMEATERGAYYIGDEPCHGSTTLTQSLALAADYGRPAPT